MLEVRELTKIFRSTKKEEKVALDRVSFKLPNKGFAFIIGKSGSGKTTLLSLIGGLDDITSGEIIYQGNKLSEFKHNEFDVYRNNEVGFIFQDYHLLEELTIFDNIKMMLDFKNIKDDKRIYDALESVGLKGYENRFPKELSGGEKQRVAIARIIVKNPSILLADEPTGNLDRKTTKQILDLLKKISKDKLVLIVSHNKSDAYEYADYIFKLKDGKILEKYIRKNEKKADFRVENETLFIGKNKKMNDEEILNLKSEINNSKIFKITQNKSEFDLYDEDIKESNEKFKNKRNHIKFSNSIKYSFKFFKKGIWKSAIFSLLVGIVSSICSLCFSISYINKEEITKNYLKEYNQTTFKVGNEDPGKLVDDQYLNELEKSGLASRVYRGYRTNKNDIAYKLKQFETFMSFDNFKGGSIYCIDDEFLFKHFGKDNNVSFLARRETDLSDGYYITDGLLESLLKREITQEDCEDVIENGYKSIYCTFNVNGVINSHFKEKYSYLFSKIDRFKKMDLTKADENIISNYLHFYTEMYTFHNALYTFNPNFLNDYMDNNSYLFMGLPIISNKERNIEARGGFFVSEKMAPEFDLDNNEIIISYKIYHSLTGKTETFADGHFKIFDEPININMDFYKINDFKLTTKLASKSLKVVGVNKFNNFAPFDLIKEVNNELFVPDAAIVEGVHNIDKFLELNKKYNHEFNNIEELLTEKIESLVISLRDFFLFIFLVLVLASIFSTGLYFVKTFNNNLFEIGVMKSLGARDKDVINMMIVDFIFTLIFTLLIFNILLIPLIGFSNTILLEGIKRVSDYKLLTRSLRPLYLKPLKILLNNLVIGAVFFISYMIQFLRIRRIKPVNIIKAKE